MTVWQFFTQGLVSSRAALDSNGGSAVARQAAIMGPFGTVMVNGGVTQRDANADAVMVNLR